MPDVRVVLDTNVLVSAFRSREGVAFRLITLLREGRIEISVSVPLVLEYEDVLLRATNLGEEDVLTTLRFLCSVADRQKIFFLIVSTAVAEKMSALMTEDYLEVLARQGDREAFDRVLDKVPAVPPDPWDRWDGPDKAD